MSVAKPIQTSFNMGVLSPEMMARTDIEQYYRGAKTIKNGVVLPQGGVTKRQGFKLLSDLDVTNTAAYFQNSGGVVRALPYLYNGAVFVVIITASGFLSVLSENGAELLAPIDISGRIFGDAIDELQYKQIVNDLVILSEHTKPFIVIRNAGGVFEVRDIPNLKPPKANFFDSFTNGGRWRKVLITFERMQNGDIFYLGDHDRTTLHNHQIVYGVVTAPLDGSVIEAGDDAAGLVASIQAALGGTVEPVYEVTKRMIVRESDGIPVSVNIRKLTGVTITKADEKKVFCTSKQRHESRIRCRPINEPVKTETASLQECWSDNRGFPSVAGEFGGRFVLAASSYQPETIWMSKIYQYYDFEVPTSGVVATSPIDVTLATEKASRITGIIDSRRLTVFTNRTAYILGGAGDDVITPDTVRAQNINIKGAKLIRPETLDDSICYVQQSGAELNSTSYEFARDTYVSIQSSIYSAHLLKEVRQMSKTLSSKQFNAEYLTCLNYDGTMAHFSSLREQEIRNWTEFVTRGAVVDIVGALSNNYAIVRRGVAGSEIITLEKMAEDSNYCDYAQSYFSSVPFDKVAGFGHLAGEQMVALADGYDIDLTVDENGVIQLPFKASNVTIGIPFDFEVEPMPLNVDFKSGSIVNTRKRINETKVTLLDSRGVSIEYAGQKYRIADRMVGFKLGEPPQPFTGVKTVKLTGWISKGSVKIKSTRPVSVTLLGLEMKVRAKG